MTNKKYFLGFTLVEIITVVGIIGLLAAGATLAFSKQRARSRDARRIQDITSVETAVENYITDHPEGPACLGDPCNSISYPNDVNSWDLSSHPVGSETFVHWLVTSGYLDKDPKDPVNNGRNGVFGDNGTGYAYGYRLVPSADYKNVDGITYAAYRLRIVLEAQSVEESGFGNRESDAKPNVAAIKNLAVPR